MRMRMKSAAAGQCGPSGACCLSLGSDRVPWCGRTGGERLPLRRRLPATNTTSWEISSLLDMTRTSKSLIVVNGSELVSFWNIFGIQIRHEQTRYSSNYVKGPKLLSRFWRWGECWRMRILVLVANFKHTRDELTKLSWTYENKVALVNNKSVYK